MPTEDAAAEVWRESGRQAGNHLKQGRVLARQQCLHWIQRGSAGSACPRAASCCSGNGSPEIACPAHAHDSSSSLEGMLSFLDVDPADPRNILRTKTRLKGDTVHVACQHWLQTVFSLLHTEDCP